MSKQENENGAAGNGKKIKEEIAKDTAIAPVDKANLAVQPSQTFDIVVDAGQKIPIIYSGGRFVFGVGEKALQNYSLVFKNYMETIRIQKELSGLPGNRNNIRIKTRLFTQAVEENMTETMFADICRDLGFAEDNISSLLNELEDLKKRRLKAWLLSQMQAGTENKERAGEVAI